MRIKKSVITGASIAVVSMAAVPVAVTLWMDEPDEQPPEVSLDVNLPQRLDAEKRYADWKPTVVNRSGQDQPVSVTFSVAELESPWPPTMLEVDDAEDMGDCVNPDDAEAADFTGEKPPTDPECTHRKETLKRQGCEVSDDDVTGRGLVVKCRTNLTPGENDFLLTLVGPDVLLPDDAAEVENYPDVTARGEIAVTGGTVSDEGRLSVD